MEATATVKRVRRSSVFAGKGPLWFVIKFFHIFGAIILFILLWEGAVRWGLVNEFVIMPPSRILEEGWEMVTSGELQIHIWASVKRVIFGFGLSLLVALPLGFLLGGWFKTVETAVNPLLQVLSQANPFTLLPVFIALMSLGEAPKITIIFWVCLWPILFNTVTGIRNVDPALVKMSRSLGLGKFQTFYKILLPGSLPTVFTGIRMSAVFAFFMLIGAEMLGATTGLGQMIHQAQSVFNMPRMWVGIVVVALLGILTNLLLLAVERYLTGWKEESTF